MTGEFLPLAAVVAGALALNLAVAWLLVRRSRDAADPFGSVASGPSAGEGDGGRSEAALGGAATDGAAGDVDGDGPSDPPPLNADGETVACRHCGAENRAGYRYCRWCVRSGFVDEDAGVTPGTAMTDRSL